MNIYDICELDEETFSQKHYLRVVQPKYTLNQYHKERFWRHAQKT